MSFFNSFLKSRRVEETTIDDNNSDGSDTINSTGITPIHRKAHNASLKSVEGGSLRRIAEEIAIELRDDPGEAKQIVEDLNEYNFPPESTALHIFIKGGAMGGPDEVRIVEALLEADPIGVSRTDAFGRSECWYRYILGLSLLE